MPDPASSRQPRLVSILIPAVGGLGGGVLSEWIVAAAEAAGLRAHSTSIPGVAQRTGSTSYYVELYTGGDKATPAFSLYPIPGALDVLLAPEFLEVGRAIELGFPSPSRTTIVASTHRLYSIHEKIATGRGVYPMEALEAAARNYSASLIAFDALAVAREHQTEVNAVLLGALAGSGVLPVGVEAFRRAIEGKGVQVPANLRGFDVGHGLVTPSSPTVLVPGSRRNGSVNGTDPTVQGHDEDEPRLARFPETLRPMLSLAVGRLIDYQDDAYAERYLERVRRILETGDLELARTVARYLAVWMTYEDAIRVADLKTRAARFERIRAGAHAPGSLVTVTDYLKPDLDELYGILPYRLVAPFARWAERRWPHGRPTVGQHVKTTTILGFLRVWLLGRLRRLRPISYRAHHEHARMDRWLDAVTRCAAWDRGLAREVARAAQLVKGYGDVRRRLTACFDTLLESVLRSASLEGALGGGFTVSTRLAERGRTLVLEGPSGEAAALAASSEAVRRLEVADRDGALARLTQA
jgi:indolepyruvate ferredoxin oxidoreductase beta subunit